MRARAHLRALMTQKSCAVGMRNAKLGNHLKINLNVPQLLGIVDSAAQNGEFERVGGFQGK